MVSLASQILGTCSSSQYTASSIDLCQFLDGYLANVFESSNLSSQPLLALRSLHPRMLTKFKSLLYDYTQGHVYSLHIDKPQKYGFLNISVCRFFQPEPLTVPIMLSLSFKIVERSSERVLTSQLQSSLSLRWLCDSFHIERQYFSFARRVVHHFRKRTVEACEKCLESLI